MVSTNEIVHVLIGYGEAKVNAYSPQTVRCQTELGPLGRVSSRPARAKWKAKEILEQYGVRSSIAEC